MVDPVTLFVNRERLLARLNEQLTKIRTDREDAETKRDAANAEVRGQLIDLLTEHPQFLVRVASIVRNEYGVAVGESFSGLAERFKNDETPDAPKNLEEERLEEFVRLYGLSDSEQVELAPGSEVIGYI